MSGAALGTIASGVGIAVGVNSLFGGGGGGATSPGQAAAAADPFGSSRGQYATQLNQLMADPSKIAQQPGYKSGMQGVERGLAAKGQLSSGREQEALFEYGSSFFDKYLQQLMNLSGANQNPAYGPQAASTALGNQSGIIQGIGSNLGTLSGIFGTGANANTSYANSLSSQPTGGGYSDSQYSQGGWFGS